MLHHVPILELQDEPFADVARVLRPGDVFMTSDSVASAELAALHHNDVYNPVDPTTVCARLSGAGFAADAAQLRVAVPALSGVSDCGSAS